MYERLLFEKAGDVNELLLKKSYCLKAEGKYQAGYETLQRADLFHGTDSLRATLYYEMALHSYLNGRYDVALGHVQELNYYLPDQILPRAELIEVLALNQLKRWQEAEKKFMAMQTKYGMRQAVTYADLRPGKLKNPDRAENWSFVLPGSGQMYAGYWGRGLTSLVIQAGLVAFTAYSFVNGFYFSGAFTGGGLFYMFYNGGTRHASYLAQKGNQQKIDRLNDRVMTTLEPVIKK